MPLAPARGSFSGPRSGNRRRSPLSRSSRRQEAASPCCSRPSPRRTTHGFIRAAMAAEGRRSALISAAALKGQAAWAAATGVGGASVARRSACAACGAPGGGAGEPSSGRAWISWAWEDGLLGASGAAKPGTRGRRSTRSARAAGRVGPGRRHLRGGAVGRRAAGCWPRLAPPPPREPGLAPALCAPAPRARPRRQPPPARRSPSRLPPAVAPGPLRRGALREARPRGAEEGRRFQPGSGCPGLGELCVCGGKAVGWGEKKSERTNAVLERREARQCASQVGLHVRWTK